MRMQALNLAADLKLSDWCIAAGFVRNLVWDKQHGHSQLTPLNDIDLIFFDKINPIEEIDVQLEESLRLQTKMPWSVKNQARMNVRNGDKPYQSTSHAMSYWVEIETAIGARLDHNAQVELIAPFSYQALFSKTITMNPNRPKPTEFQTRIDNKRWLEIWPNLKVVN